jgi:hypothetical protein
MSALLRTLSASALVAASLVACSDIVPVPKNRPDWVDAGPEPPPPDAHLPDQFDTAAEMIAAFGSCMSYDDWVTQRLDQLPLQITELGDPCYACHADQGSAYLNADPVRTYERHRTTPSIYKIALPILDSTTGEPVEVVQNDRYITKGEEDVGHDLYRLDPTVVQGLDRFFDLTYARFTAQAGDCVPDEPE